MPISSPSSVTVQRRMSLLTVNRSVSASDGIKSAAPVPRKVIFIDLSRFLRSPVCDKPVFPAKNAAEAHSGSCCASPALFHCSTIPEKIQKCFCHPDFRRAPRVYSSNSQRTRTAGLFTLRCAIFPWNTSVFLRKNVLLNAKIPRCRSHWELEEYTLGKILLPAGLCRRFCVRGVP